MRSIVGSEYGGRPPPLAGLWVVDLAQIDKCLLVHDEFHHKGNCSHFSASWACSARCL